MHVHFIGICGQGVSSMALYFLDQGHTVTGYDAKRFPIADTLEQRGAVCAFSDEGEEVPPLPAGTEMVIRSGSARYGEAFPQRLEAVEQGLPMHTYNEYLGELTRQYRTIAVCGTHGKTTTVGMTATMLQGASESPPTVIGGAYLPQWGGVNYHAGAGEWLLIEACEYQQNFLHYSPEVVICTNIELDHTNYFTDDAHYDDAFARFFARAGVVLFHAEDTRVAACIARAQQQYGSSVVGVAVPALIQRVEMGAIGQHNQENATLVLALAQQLELPEERAREALRGFLGTARRQQYLGTVLGVELYDDYGHHPTAIVRTIAAFRQAHPGKKIAVVFEFIDSRIALFDAFLEALLTADTVAVMPTFSLDGTVDRQYMERFITAAAERGKRWYPAVESADLLSLCEQMGAEGIVVGMGPRLVSGYLQGVVSEYYHLPA